MEDEVVKSNSPETKAFIEKGDLEGAIKQSRRELIESVFAPGTLKYIENQTPAEDTLRATVALLKAELSDLNAKKKSAQELIDALRLVGKCRRSKGGGVCDPCWAEVTKALKDLDVGHLWGF